MYVKILQKKHFVENVWPANEELSVYVKCITLRNNQQDWSLGGPLPKLLKWF